MPKLAKSGVDTLVKQTLNSKISVECIPSGLRDSLLEALDHAYPIYYDDFIHEYGKFYEYRTAFMILIVLLYLELNPHRKWEGWQALTWKQLRRLFRGNREVIQYIRDGVFFDCDHKYRKGGYSKAAKLDDDTKAIIDEVLRNYCENPTDPTLLDRSGKLLIPQHVAKKPHAKTKPLLIANLPLYTKTNLEAVTAALRHIELWLETGVDEPHPTDDHPKLTAHLEKRRKKFEQEGYKPKKGTATERFRTYLKKARKQLMLVLAFGGCVPNNIQMSAAGRLYGPFLQNCLKVVRMVALHGHWNYDFQCCHHRIFQHHAKLYGIPCPVLDQYNLDKDQFRIDLADELEVSVEQVKSTLLALGYGAGITSWRFVSTDDPNKPLEMMRAAIHQILGPEAFEKAKMSEKITGLRSELTAISDRMLAEAKTVKGKGLLINARGLPLPLKDENGKDIHKAKQKAHIVQGIESQLLISLISSLTENRKSGREYFVVLGLHDGCVSRVKRNLKQLEEAVAAGRAKINLKIECEKYDLMDLTTNSSRQNEG